MADNEKPLDLAKELDALGAGKSEYAIPEVIGEAADLIRSLIAERDKTQQIAIEAFIDWTTGLQDERQWIGAEDVLPEDAPEWLRTPVMDRAPKAKP